MSEDIMVRAADLPDHERTLTQYAFGGLTPEAANELEEHAARILTHSQRAIIEIGKELLAAREVAAYGTWTPFLERCGMQERTAQNYMQVARKFIDQPEIVSALPATALYALSADSADQAEVAKVIGEVQAGATPSITEIKARVAPAKPAQKPAPAPTLFEVVPPPATTAGEIIAEIDDDEDDHDGDTDEDAYDAYKLPAFTSPPGSQLKTADRPLDVTPSPAPTRQQPPALTIVPAAAPARQLPPALPIATAATPAHQLPPPITMKTLLLLDELLAAAMKEVNVRIGDAGGSNGMRVRIDEARLVAAAVQLLASPALLSAASMLGLSVTFED